MEDFPKFFKSVINIRIRTDQYRKIKEANMNISEFVRNKLDEEFETTETLEQEERELQEKIKEIKIKKEKMIAENNNKENMPKDEEKYLKQMKEHARMYGIEDALDNYNNKFEKKISVEKFRKMIEAVANG